MAETTDTVRIVLRAVDQASDEILAARQALDQNTAAVSRASGATRAYSVAAVDGDRQTRRLNNSIERLTSGSSLAASAITRMQGVLIGIPFGIVIGAVYALTQQITEQVQAWIEAKTALDRYREGLVSTLELAKRQAAVTALLKAQAEAQRQLKDAQAALNELYGGGTFRALDLAQSRVRRLQAELAAIRRDLDLVGKPDEAIAPSERGGGRPPGSPRVPSTDPMAEYYDSVAAIRAADRARTEQATLAHDQWMIDQTNATNGAIFAAHSAHSEAILAIERNVQQTQLAGALGIANTLLSAATGKSKALFALSKALGVAQIVVATNVAAAQALAHPPGPPTTIPLAASVKAWGYANAAATAAVGLAQTFGGLGGGPSGDRGGGSIGGPTVVSSVPPGARDITPPTIQITNYYENLVGLDQPTIDRLTNAQMDTIGQLLKDRGGVIGGVKIEHRSLSG